MPDRPCTDVADGAPKVADAIPESRRIVGEIEAALALAKDLGDPSVVAAVEACLASARGQFAR